MQGRPDLMHPGLRPSFDDPLAHPFSAVQAMQQQELQRQLLLDRERMAAAASAGTPHPGLMSQHEEYIRQQQQQRERELKNMRDFDVVRGRPGP